MRAVETLGNRLLPAFLVALVLLPGGQTSSALPGAPASPLRTAPTSSATVSGASPKTPQLSNVRPIIDLLADSLRLPRARAAGIDATAVADLVKLDERRHSVDFFVVTVPDYVDSNSGWMADEILDAVQAAMGRSDHVLDRFILPEASRPEGNTGSALLASDQGRLHETQPGVLIFRDYDDDWKRIVVLVVLETPTSGIHRAAFDHAVRLIDTWFDKTGRQPRLLKIIGPTFSGSTSSLAAAVTELPTRFQAVHVVTGSASADENETIILNACWARPTSRDCSYQATAHTADVVKRTLASFLRSMNPRWLPGRVALLVESNTTFGRAVSSLLSESVPDDHPDARGPSLKGVRTFQFPLHIAQLRDDARTSARPNLLNLPIPSLNLRDSAVTSDQLPAFRPELTSAITETTVDAMLDDIRHEGFAAVGFVATDVRDILFLSREVKRAVPDVQLFYSSAHRLYLHPEFVPYTRGAIIASTYPIAVVNQTPGNRSYRNKSSEKPPSSEHPSSGNREAFQGTIAEGVFNATLVQLGEDGQLADYFASASYDASAPNTRPDVWVSVVGDDAFWPLTRVSDTDTGHSMAAARAALRLPPLPLPLTAYIGLLVVALFLLVHLAAVVPKFKANFRTRATDAASGSGLLGLVRQVPLLNVLATPVALKSTRRLHGRVRALACGHAAVVAFWAASLLWVSTSGGAASWQAASGGVLFIPLLGLVLLSSRGIHRVNWWGSTSRGWMRTLTPAALPVATLVEGAIAVCLAAPLLLLALSVSATYWHADTARLAAERTLGGGIVSTAPATMALLVALYVPLFWTLRRLSTVGIGYRSMVARSRAFRLVFGDPGGRGAGSSGAAHRTQSDAATGNPTADTLWTWAALLDAPLRYLPRPYFAVVGLAMMISALVLARTGSTVEGPLFSWFLRVSSLVVLAGTSILLAQAAEVWRLLRMLLVRLAHSPLITAFARLEDAQLRWNVSVSAPCAQDLGWLVQLASSLKSSLPDAALAPPDHDRMLAAFERLERQEARLRSSRQVNWHARSTLLQSPSWFHLWHLADALVDLLSAARWTTRSAFGLIHSPAPATGAASQLATAAPGKPPSKADLWFTRSETLVAALFAFALRDVVARIMSAMFAAMVCLGLLTGAHLFYVFQGRPSFLTLDMLALAVGSLAAVRGLVGMERDTVLSLMWQTTPGRITFNWGLMQRLTVYGALPLIIIVGSLFPEIGEPILKWLEPLRKLVTI